jgi:hypothetical protein
MEIPSDAEIDKHLNKYMNMMEKELGQDIIPIVIIMMCRVAVKYNLNIDWLVTTIIMGYNNELPPEIDKGEISKFDS